MRFSDWFAAQADLTQDAFSKRVGVTQGRIAQLLDGDLPSMGLAIRIREATCGSVGVDDWQPKVPAEPIEARA